eukprot:evm.model.NODE_12890_length_15232_cov_17.794052.5
MLLAAARGQEQADAPLAALDGGAANGMHIVVDHPKVPTPASSSILVSSAAPAALSKGEEPEFMESIKSTSNVRKRKWTREEDRLLLALVAKHGTRSWSLFAPHLNRTGKKCRERWHNQINPEINHSAWTIEEENILVMGYAEFGSRWSEIGKLLPGRTENSIKNRWNAAKRRMMRRGMSRAKTTEESLRKSNSTSKGIAPALVPPPSAVSVLGRLYKGRGREDHKEEEGEQERGEEQHLLVHPAAPRLYMGQRTTNSSSSGNSRSSSGGSSSDMRWCANVSTWTGSRRNLQPACPSEKEHRKEVGEQDNDEEEDNEEEDEEEEEEGEEEEEEEEENEREIGEGTYKPSCEPLERSTSSSSLDTHRYLLEVSRFLAAPSLCKLSPLSVPFFTSSYSFSPSTYPQTDTYPICPPQPASTNAKVYRQLQKCYHRQQQQQQQQQQRQQQYQAQRQQQYQAQRQEQYQQQHASALVRFTSDTGGEKQQQLYHQQQRQHQQSDNQQQRGRQQHKQEREEATVRSSHPKKWHKHMLAPVADAMQVKGGGPEEPGRDRERDC